MEYKRDAFELVRGRLNENEVQLVVGPRQVGKTVVLGQIRDWLVGQGQEVVMLTLEDPDYLGMLNESPKNLAKIIPIGGSGRQYVLIDEVQYLKDPSNFLKYWFDVGMGKVKMVVTGSSAFYVDRKFNDSLAGRKKIYTMLTLGWKEFWRFKTGRSWVVGKSGVTVSESEAVEKLFYEYMTYGGYPKVVMSEGEVKKDVLRELVYAYVKKDVLEAGVKQDEVFMRLLKILAAQVGALVNTNELANTLGVSRTAIENYLYVMKKSFHLWLAGTFSNNVRKELVKMPKVYFNDLGLRNYLVGEWGGWADRKDQGQLLENTVWRMLVDIYGMEEVKFWRTSGGNEVDLVVSEVKKAFEVKVSGGQVKWSRYKKFLAVYPEIELVMTVLTGVKAGMVKAWEV